MRIPRLIQVAIVGRDHSPLGAVHEQGRTPGLSFDLLAKRPDQVRAEDADAVAQDFRMDRVVDERGDRLAAGADRLDDAHPPVIQVGRVIVVGDLPLRLAGGDLDPGRLESVDRLVDGLRRLVADEIHVVQVAGVSTLAIGERIAIGGAMRVRGADDDVRGRDATDLRPHTIPEHRRKPEQVQRHHGHGRVALAEHHRPRREIPTLLSGRFGDTHPAGDGQELLGRDHPHRGPGLDLGAGLGGDPQRAGAGAQDEPSSRHSGHLRERIGIGSFARISAPGYPHQYRRSRPQARICRIGRPCSTSSRLRPGISSRRESRPSNWRIVAWMSVT